MAKPSSVLCLGSRRGEGRLAEICELLARAGAGPFTLEPAEIAGASSAGVMLAGEDPQQRQAAAELAGRLYRAEEEIESLCSEILERYEEAALVYRLSQRLASVFGESSIAALIVEEASRTLSTRCGELWIADGETVALAASVPEDHSMPLDLREQGPLAALKEGRPWAREASVGGEAVVAVPLPSAGGTPLGVLVLRGRTEGRSFRTGDMKMLTALAGLASAFIRNCRLAEQTRRIEARELRDEIAQQVHFGLLPADSAMFDGLEIVGSCRASVEIGGGYYDFLPMPDGNLGLVLAELSGHGVAVAMRMAASRAVLQAEARRIVSPADLLRRAHDVLTPELKRSQSSATAFVARFHPGGRRIECANAGHCPALLVRANGRTEALSSQGPALGSVDGPVHYAGEARPLEPGDLLVFHSEGLVDARDAAGHPFGVERLAALSSRCRYADARSIHEQILDEMFRHCGASPPGADVTLVVVRIVPQVEDCGRKEDRP